MRTRSIAFRIPRYSTLSVSLAIGLGISLPLTAGAAAHANAAPSFVSAHKSGDVKTGQPWQPNPKGPRPTPLTHTVDTCADDDSAQSLRTLIAGAGNDDTIDLTHLPMGCSTITLDSSTHAPSYIKVSQSYLHILGPGSGLLTIDGNFDSSILRHVGYGTLDIKGVTIANGKYASDTQPFGGCIYSKGTVALDSSRLDHCRAAGTSMVGAEGGGVYASIGLTLYRSSITDSAAFDTQDHDANGGGAFVGGNLKTTYATLSDNYASSAGGGAYVAGGTISISSSTISSNRARFAGGLYLSDTLGTAEIINSTISGNQASVVTGGVFVSGNLKLANSTVAFNRDQFPSYSGLYAAGPSLVLESSIIAGNGGANGPADLRTKPTTMMSGSHNLIVAGTSIPAGTIRDCPQLDLLQNNGGVTLTHAIRQTSPAVDEGNAENLLFDQTGNPRVEGIAADIGAFEWRAGTGNERVFAGGFDGLCDQ